MYSIIFLQYTAQSLAVILPSLLKYDWKNRIHLQVLNISNNISILKSIFDWIQKWRIRWKQKQGTSSSLNNFLNTHAFMEIYIVHDNYSIFHVFQRYNFQKIGNIYNEILAIIYPQINFMMKYAIFCHRCTLGWSLFLKFWNLIVGTPHCVPIYKKIMQTKFGVIWTIFSGSSMQLKFSMLYIDYIY